ncbi:hypothetical protein F442_09954 [Phytophthora nicotianae P10297]|uniref:Uncharacterized protein n=1 Tax=Phytophthora nicotianae P10297 TaxID=1317064 RepID=W2ZAK6_PHYNI|nr:hypothetical protein F442_09954 [Phytophthora nicotianae P10297]
MGPKKKRFRRSHGSDDRFISSGSAALPIKRAMQAETLTREEKLALLREYSNRKREKERSYREFRKNQMRIRYYRSRGYIKDDANDDDTESKIGEITEQYSEESTEGGVEVDLEAKNDDDVEQRREACNENVEGSIEDGGEGDLEAKNVKQEEIKEQTPTGRLGNVVASYTTIQRNLHFEKFPLPYIKSSWNFDEDDKPALCLFETTDGRGFGVKTLEEIPRQTFVNEYLGELIDAETKETLGDTKYIFEVLAGDKDECISTQTISEILPSSSTTVVSQIVGL